MKRKKSNGPLQVEYICPRCGKHLAWAVPGAYMSCPRCGTWVTDANRRRENEVFLPADSEQTVLF